MRTGSWNSNERTTMYKLIAIGLLLLLISGCGYARGSHQLLPTAELVGPKQLGSYEDVTLYQKGSGPTRGCVHIARIGADGNGYATRDDLEKTLRREAHSLHADVVVVMQAGTSSSQIGTYGGGLAMGQTINYPHLVGTACRTGSIWHGVVYATDVEKFLVKYVRSGSPAEKAGVMEGDEVVTVNGFYLGDDPYVWAREVSAKPPLTTVGMEVLRNGSKQRLQMVLEAPR